MARAHHGFVIVESLADPSIVDRLRITHRRTYKVPDPQAGQPPEWDGVAFEVGDDADAAELARQISAALQPGPWWVDLSSDRTTYVVFSDAVFSYTDDDQSGRDAAVEHGRARGLPERQLAMPRRGSAERPA